MRKIDKKSKNSFSKQINKCDDCLNSIYLNKIENEKRGLFNNQTVKDIYETIYKEINDRLEVIFNYISSYDYISYDERLFQETINEINRELEIMSSMINKMNQLDNMYIKLESDTIIPANEQKLNDIILSLEELKNEK